MFLKLFTKICLCNSVNQNILINSSYKVNRKILKIHSRFIHNSSSQLSHEQQKRMGIVCTCNVCSNGFSKTFSKHSYEKGVVIIKCPKCESNHLIADHLSWFQDVNGKNIEEILAAKGEAVKFTSESNIDQTGVLELDNHQDTRTEDKSNLTQIKNEDTLKLPKN